MNNHALKWLYAVPGRRNRFSNLCSVSFGLRGLRAEAAVNKAIGA